MALPLVWQFYKGRNSAFLESQYLHSHQVSFSTCYLRGFGHLRLWTSHVTSVDFSFFICNMDVRILPDFRSCCDNEALVHLRHSARLLEYGWRSGSGSQHYRCFSSFPLCLSQVWAFHCLPCKVCKSTHLFSVFLKEGFITPLYRVKQGFIKRQIPGLASLSELSGREFRNHIFKQCLGDCCAH